MDRSQRCCEFVLPEFCGQDSAEKGSVPPVSSPLLFLVSTDERGNRCGVLAAQSFSAPSGHLGDNATILHAGPLSPPGGDATAPAISGTDHMPADLIRRFDQVLADRGVRFVQWATDPVNDSTAAIAALCDRMGMQPLATLEYLCAQLDEISPTQVADDNEASDASLHLVPVDWQDPSNIQDFQSLVQRTYQDTADCPELCKFRNAAQTLQGYREVDSFDASRWYFVGCRNEVIGPVGCVILSSHRSSSRRSSELRESKTSMPTSELVYMALAPEFRGNGWGRSLVRLTLSEPNDRFAKATLDPDRAPQIVLAVDQQNSVARKLYRNAGFQRLLGETVWGKSVGDTFSTIS